jgi:hypothetical protein
VEQENSHEHIEHVRPVDAALPKVTPGHMPEEESTHNTTQTDPYRPSFWRRLNASFRNSNIWIAIFTGLLLIVAYYQMIASQEATKAASEAIRISKVTERAYVAVKNVEVEWTTGKIYLTLENTGKIPTQTVNIRVSAFRLNTTDMTQIASDTQAVPLYENDISPGVYVNKIVIQMTKLLSHEELAVASGRETIAIMAGITYGDGFDADNHTAFACEYIHNRCLATPLMNKERWLGTKEWEEYEKYKKN